MNGNAEYAEGEGSNSFTNGNSEQTEDDAKWAAALEKATITNWGGMISTPDENLQDSIHKILVQLGCPVHVAGELIECSHEKRWPAGLNTLATRQHSRLLYEKYVCKRIPGMQAIVLLHCDNTHMADDMILKPGILMAFAYGVE